MSELTNFLKFTESGTLAAQRAKEVGAAQSVLMPSLKFGRVSADIATDGRVTVAFDNPIVVRGVCTQSEALALAQWILRMFEKP